MSRHVRAYVTQAPRERKVKFRLRSGGEREVAITPREAPKVKREAVTVEDDHGIGRCAAADEIEKSPGFVGGVVIGHVDGREPAAVEKETHEQRRRNESAGTRDRAV